MKRMSHTMDDELYNAVKEVADRRGMPVTRVLNRFVALGLDIYKAQKKGGKIVVSKGNKETNLKLYL